MPTPETKQYKGSGYGTAMLGKDMFATLAKIEKLQEDAAEGLKKEEWWKTAGGWAATALGSAALAAVTGGASLATQVAVAGGSHWFGRQAGSELYKASNTGKRVKDLKKLEGSLMQKSKGEQGEAFKDMVKGQEKSDLTNTALAMLGQAYFSPGGKEAMGKTVEWGGKKIFGEGFEMSKKMKEFFTPVTKVGKTAGGTVATDQTALDQMWGESPTYTASAGTGATTASSLATEKLAGIGTLQRAKQYTARKYAQDHTTQLASGDQTLFENWFKQFSS